MTEKSKNHASRLGRIITGTALAAALIGTSTAASAARWGVQLSGGVANLDIKEGGAAVVWDPGWSWWEIGGWHFAFVAEGRVGYLHYGGGAAIHPNIWSVGATPVFRFIKDSGYVRPFIEAGAGVRFLSHPTIAQTLTKSTSFQFGEIVGVGAQFGNRQQYQAGFRFEHMSNAGIKDPNPGINFSQIYVQYNF